MATQTELIVKLRADTAKLRQQLSETERKMKGFHGRMNKTANMIQTSLLSAFGGFAVIQGIQRSTRTVVGFEKQMSKVAAVSRASSDEMQKLEQSAIDIGAASRFTATEIGTLQEELARLGFGLHQIVTGKRLQL